ncbi:hypothetical protein CPC08DRAFT_794106 [Agrocybe pediades]|nr:hypothetical protein CPC08DRAFT_794106 [Agrocybe pediades]
MAKRVRQEGTKTVPPDVASAQWALIEESGPYLRQARHLVTPMETERVNKEFLNMFCKLWYARWPDVPTAGDPEPAKSAEKRRKALEKRVERDFFWAAMTTKMPDKHWKVFFEEKMEDLKKHKEGSLDALKNAMGHEKERFEEFECASSSSAPPPRSKARTQIRRRRTVEDLLKPAQKGKKPVHVVEDEEDEEDGPQKRQKNCSD